MSRSGWLVTNKSRSYPLTESSSHIDDAGKLFPENLLVDVRLFVTGDEASPVYLSQYAANATQVSVSFAQGNNLVGTAYAAAGLLQEATPVSVMSPDGTPIGTLVFGDFSPFTLHKFSSASQSSLSDHAVAFFDQPLVQPRFSRDVSVPLQPSDIFFTGQGDLEITEEYVTTEEGEIRKQISIGLRQTAGADLLLDYAGDSNLDAESERCGSPEPFNRFGQVRPDCCGRIFIEFRGCVSLLKIDGQCGVIVKCGVKLDEICPQRSEPVVNNLTEDGELRPKNQDYLSWAADLNALNDPVTNPNVPPPEGCDGPNLPGKSGQVNE